MSSRGWLVLSIACGCGGVASPTAQPLTLVMRTPGQAQGSVIATSGGKTLFTCAAGTCTAQAAPGSTVTLTSAAAGPDSIFSGWSGDCAGDGPTCDLTMTKQANVTAQFRPAANFVFETSVALRMPFGATAAASQAAADGLCAARAAAAGLPGRYVAWLSTSTVDAVTKLGGANGWVRTDGRPFARTRADLLAGKIFYPLAFDENGGDAGQATLFSTATGTAADGTALAGGTCGDWTSTAGSTSGLGVASGGSKAWTAAPYALSCAGPFPVYCFETAFDHPVTATATGRLAFVSKKTFKPGPGKTRADADAICQSEAQAAGLPGPFTDYLALLAVAGERPIARFSTASGSLPWVRPDGVLIVAQASDMVSAAPLMAPIDVAADGTYWPGGFTWTGAGADNLAGDPSSTCGDWSSTANSGNGGQIEYTIHWLDEYRNSLTCLADLPVFCLRK